MQHRDKILPRSHVSPCIKHQKPSISQRKAGASAERQDSATPQTEKQMLKSQAPGYHWAFRMASIHRTCSSKGHTVTQDRPVGFITKSRDEAQWLPLNSMVTGRARALYILGEVTDKGEMKSCNGTPIKQYSTEQIPTRHCDNRTTAPFPVSQKTAAIN